MKEIEEQIKWYDDNATRKDDGLIKANLKLINNLYNEIENSEDKIFLDKIINTFCEIIEIQKEVINDVAMAAEQGGLSSAPNQQAFAVDYSDIKEFSDDKQIQNAFTSYCLGKGKSSYTVNDYCSRIKNLWKSFYEEYKKGELPKELIVNEEEINLDTPLLNAYHHIDVLTCYVSMMIAISEGSRNWLNTRAALNKFSDFGVSIEAKERSVF